jgi:hypothetical protein
MLKSVEQLSPVPTLRQVCVEAMDRVDPVYGLVSTVARQRVSHQRARESMVSEVVLETRIE